MSWRHQRLLGARQGFRESRQGAGWAMAPGSNGQGQSQLDEPQVLAVYPLCASVSSSETASSAHPCLPRGVVGRDSGRRLSSQGADTSVSHWLPKTLNSDTLFRFQKVPVRWVLDCRWRLRPVLAFPRGRACSEGSFLRGISGDTQARRLQPRSLSTGTDGHSP